MSETNAVQTFHFEGLAMRTVVGPDGEPWFVAKDVCEALGLGNVTEAVRGLDEDERCSEILNTPGGPQKMVIISEPGYYNLTSSSKKPAAKRLNRLVCHKVLPSLRKHGFYSMNGQGDPLLAQVVAISNKMSAAIANLSELTISHDKKIDKVSEDIVDIKAKVLDIETRMPRTRYPSKTDMKWIKDMAGMLGGRDPLYPDRSLFDGGGNFIGEVDHIDDNPRTNHRRNLWPLHPDTHKEKRLFSRAELDAASNHWHNQAARAEPYNYDIFRSRGQA